MDSQTFLNLFKKGESQDLEYKSRVPKYIGEYICALAYLNGGKTLRGIYDEGDLMGYKNREYVEDFLKALRAP